MNANAAGGLYESELERHDLGRYHGHALTALVQRRRLRLALGTGRAVRIELGEARPLAVEATAGDGTTARVPIPRQPAAAEMIATRLALMWMASWAVLWIGRQLRAY